MTTTETFEWFKPYGAKASSAYVRFNKGRAYISAEACRLAGLRPGDRVVFGYNGKFIVIRKINDGEVGYILFKSGSTSSHALHCTCSSFIKALGISNWRMKVSWQGQMLVGERPGKRECA